MNEKSICSIVYTDRTTELSPYVFGHNLEHTRACIYGGLSAQMLRNRKFAGKPSKNEGCPAEWFSINGDHAFFMLDNRAWETDDSWNGKAFTHHLAENKMRRINEVQSLDIQNLTGEECGIGQNGLYVKEGLTYELRIAALSDKPIDLNVALTDRDGAVVYAQSTVRIASGEWTVYPFEMVPTADDAQACLRLTFCRQGRMAIGALSMMAAGHFRGMRRDVIDDMKALGIGILRWPGGNFAGEYRWRDMFLPVDERAPLQAYTEIETQPYSHGYDNHEIDTDDFIALCREIGAEPFLTINLGWDDPQDSAAWVEYCNGSTDTFYGRKRAERGHAEPYNVHFWSLGNEMGFGHMEGPMTPENYASLARLHAEAMKAVSPGIELFSSGPYPNREWAVKSAGALRDVASYASLHSYSFTQMSFYSPDLIRSTYERICNVPESLICSIRYMREYLGNGIHISFDEWNYWYAWYRPVSVAEGMFAAGMLHMLMLESVPMDMPVCCYFQPLGEGAIEITPMESRLTAIGQVFELMKAHKGGRLCVVDTEASLDVAATIKNDVITVTMINRDYADECPFELVVPGTLTESIMLSSDSVLPHARFIQTDLEVSRSENKTKAVLKPHSIARLTYVAAPTVSCDTLLQ